MKVIIILGIIFFNNLSFGQITTTKISEKKENISIVKYDSLKNFLAKNVNQYLNQELYLKGKAESLREYGYRGFLIDYREDNRSLKNTYKPVIPTNKSYLKYDMGGGKTEYDSIAEKYFKVLKIFKHPKGNESKYLYGKKYFLKLVEKKSKDTLYYEYDSEFESSFPFIVVGFFNKLKQKNINKLFVLGSTKARYGEEELDLETGLPIKFILGSIWKCIDLTIDEKYYNLVFILQDELQQKLTINYEFLNKEYDVYSKKDSENYKKKFGLTNWNTILLGKVSIGMSKEMCELSWGKPKDINKTISSGRNSEQWVYDENYLYFENGILRTIQ